jgi:CPW-WPC domain-containing protein
VVLFAVHQSSPLDEMRKIAASGSLDIIPADNGLGSSFRNLKHVPQPIQPSQVFIDPDLLSDVCDVKLVNIFFSKVNACDRDFTQRCPNGFEDVGSVHGAAVGYCAPNKLKYNGPCNNDVVSFADYSELDKKLWSKACRTSWPCKSKSIHASPFKFLGCERNYSAAVS